MAGAVARHIVLTCWGSHGDIDPFLGLGLGLRARGHRITIATLPYYRELIEAAGLGFRPLGPELDPTDTPLVERIMHPSRGSEFLLSDILYPAIEASYRDVNAAAEDADLLISHPVTFATPIVAERRGIPWANVVLAPTSMFSAYDIPAVPPAPWVKSLQRLGPWPGRLIIGFARAATDRWARPIYEFRQRLGLGRGGNPVMEGQHSPSLVLAMYSKLLGQPQRDWPPHVVVTGHVFHDAPHGTALAPELQDFLERGPAPIVFTLGSSVVMIAHEFWHESIAAARRLGARAVLLAGPTRLDELRARLREEAGAEASDIIAVERAPHSLLFPHASVVVQQCGIGTLAQSLRSGRPMLGVPYSHDQPDNAWRARELGMSKTIYPQRYRAARVAAALDELRSDARYARAAARVAEVVRAERGVVAACDAIERTFWGNGIAADLAGQP